MGHDVLAVGRLLCCCGARGGGAIVSIVSGAGVELEMAMPQSAFAHTASTVCTSTLTQYVVITHGKENIRCNAIAPGLIVMLSTQRPTPDGPVGATFLRHHSMLWLG